MPIIIVSRRDLAGLTIKQQLLEIGEFEKTGKEFEGERIYQDLQTGVPLITIQKRLIDADYLDHHFKTDLYIFASKHKSESERPSLLVHAPGNWTEDHSFGGNPKELAFTSAIVIKQVLRLLMAGERKGNLGYEVSSEVTHHGPTNLKYPCVFIELGSDERYWQDKEGAQVVAESILQLIRNPKGNETFKSAIGFGGPHYASHFNKVQLLSQFAVSHIAPKYVLDGINDQLIIQAIQRTIEPVKYAILDWKGMNKLQREKLIPILEDIGLETIRARKISSE